MKWIQKSQRYQPAERARYRYDTMGWRFGFRPWRPYYGYRLPKIDSSAGFWHYTSIRWYNGYEDITP